MLQLTIGDIYGTYPDMPPGPKTLISDRSVHIEVPDMLITEAETLVGNLNLTTNSVLLFSRPATYWLDLIILLGLGYSPHTYYTRSRAQVFAALTDYRAVGGMNPLAVL